MCTVDRTPLESSNLAADDDKLVFDTSMTGRLERSRVDAISITPDRRILLWVLAWFAATAVMTGFQFIMLRLAWLFPIGLAFHLASDEVTQNLICFLGWLLYLGLSIYGLTRRDRRCFYVAYAVLIVLLVLNVTGCHVEISQMHFGC